TAHHGWLSASGPAPRAFPPIRALSQRTRSRPHQVRAVPVVAHFAGLSMYYTVAEIAEQLGLSDETILAHIRAKPLPASNVGNGEHRPRWRIAQAAFDSFLASRTPAKPPGTRSSRRKKPQPATEYF